MHYLNNYLFSDDGECEPVVSNTSHGVPESASKGESAGREFSLSDHAGLWIASALYNIEEISSASSNQNISVLMNGSWKHLKIAISDIWTKYLPIDQRDTFPPGKREVYTHNIPQYWTLISEQHRKVIYDQLAILKQRNPAVFAQVEELPPVSLEGCCFGMMLNLFVHFLSLPPEKRTPENFSKCFSAYQGGTTPEAIASQLIYQSLPGIPTPDSFEFRNQMDTQRVHDNLETYLKILGREMLPGLIMHYLNDTECYHTNKEQRVIRALQIYAFLEQAEKSSEELLVKYARLLRRMLAEEGCLPYRCLDVDLNSILGEVEYSESYLCEIYWNTVEHFDHKRNLEIPDMEFFEKMRELVRSREVQEDDTEQLCEVIELLECLSAYISYGVGFERQTSNLLEIFRRAIFGYLNDANALFLYQARGLNARFPKDPCLLPFRPDDENFFAEFPPKDSGTYEIVLYTGYGSHVICYQQYPDGTAHLGDPNYGLIRLTSDAEEQRETLKRLINLYPRPTNQEGAVNHFLRARKITRLDEEE